MAIRLIDPNTFGTADHVSAVKVVRKVQFGGFEAWLVDQAPTYQPIYVHATMWKGSQPRLILNPKEPGYDDWRRLLDATPEISETQRFVGAAEAARNTADQWLTHGPSRLLSSAGV